MLARPLLAFLLIGSMLLAGGCPTGVPGTSPPPTSEVNATALGPETVPGGTDFSLAVALDGDTSGLSYQWFQTSGPRAEFTVDADGIAYVVAPAVEREQRAGFRVDVLSAGSVVASAVIAVTFEPRPLIDDPGTDPNEDGGGGGGGGGGDGGTTTKTIRVEMRTSKGVVIMDLYADKAPVTVDNFLKYVDDKFYDNTLFHRVVPNFVVQGGGFTTGMVEKTTRPPIKSEASNGLKNNRGSVAMARTSNVSSATSQFYVNVKNNNDLDYGGPSSPGYTVFGVVVTGMDVIDEIAGVPTTTADGGHQNVPVDDVLILSIRRTLNNFGGR